MNGEKSLLERIDLFLNERILSTKQRKSLDKSQFAVPEKAPGPGSYPIPDLAHARNALARVAQFGSPSLQKKVQAAVYNKYPELKKRKEEREAA